MRSDRRSSSSHARTKNEFAPPRELYAKKAKAVVKPKEPESAPLNFDDEIGDDGYGKT